MSMELTLIPVLAHIGHWTEAAMIAPAAVLVIVLSIRSMMARDYETNGDETT
jgi:hypothetical protein